MARNILVGNFPFYEIGNTPIHGEKGAKKMRKLSKGRRKKTAKGNDTKVRDNALRLGLDIDIWEFTREKKCNGPQPEIF